MLNLEDSTYIAYSVLIDATNACTSYPDMGRTTRCGELYINTAVDSFYYPIRQQLVLSSTTNKPCSLLRIRVRLAGVTIEADDIGSTNWGRTVRDS